MNKKEMIAKMEDICFKVHGVSLQLGVGHLLKAAAATTPQERERHIRAASYTGIPASGLSTLTELIAAIHPEDMELDELPEPFRDIEAKSEEEIAEWIVQEMKEARSRAEKEEKA